MLLSNIMKSHQLKKYYILLLLLIINCDPSWNYKLKDPKSISKKYGYMAGYKDYKLYAKAHFFGASITLGILIVPNNHKIIIYPNNIKIKSMHSMKQQDKFETLYKIKKFLNPNIKRIKKYILNNKSYTIITIYKNEILKILYTIKGFDFSSSFGYANPKKNNFIIEHDYLNNKIYSKLFFHKI